MGQRPRAFNFVRREAAERYLLFALLGFAAAVSITRLFLALTGYPQIATGELHIAHVLWGGLLLFAAALLPLVLAGRWVLTASSMLAGVGVGLFIDEVGKFITQRNDYFYPAAAPIIYTFFLLTLLLLVHVRRITRPSAHPDLHEALDEILEALDHPLKPKQAARLRDRLEAALHDSQSERHVNLARSLLGFLEGESAGLDEDRPRPERWPGWRFPRGLAQLFSQSHLRLLLIIGLAAVGLLSLKNPAQELLGRWLPPELNAWMAGLYLGRRVIVGLAPFWFGLRLALELVIGALLLTSACLLMSRHRRSGCTLGYVALLLSLTTVNLLLFYFEQFSTIITTAIQFLLLLGLLVYRQRLPVGETASARADSAPA